MAKWFVNRNGKQAGPFETAQLKNLAADGKIHSSDQIRRDDQETWYKAESVKGLFQTLMKPQVVPSTGTQEADASQPTDASTQQNEQSKSSKLQSQPSLSGWYRLVDGGQVGPVDFKDLCEQYKSGVFGTTELIAQAGMSWLQAGIFLEQAVIASATSEDEWFIIGSEQPQGPYAFSYLQQRFANKELPETSLIGRSGAKGIAASNLIPAGSGTSHSNFLTFLKAQTNGDLRFICGIFG